VTDQQQPPKPPAKSTKKRKLSVRVTERGHDRIAARAAAEDITPSHMVRRMLAFADEHMPAGYVPGRARNQNAPRAGQRRDR
jgi:predicted HicB family RNase H-like nuclease